MVLTRVYTLHKEGNLKSQFPSFSASLQGCPCFPKMVWAIWPQAGKVQQRCPGFLEPNTSLRCSEGLTFYFFLWESHPITSWLIGWKSGQAAAEYQKCGDRSLQGICDPGLGGRHSSNISALWKAPRLPSWVLSATSTTCISPNSILNKNSSLIHSLDHWWVYLIAPEVEISLNVFVISTANLWQTFCEVSYSSNFSFTVQEP